MIGVTIIYHCHYLYCHLFYHRKWQCNNKSKCIGTSFWLIGDFMNKEEYLNKLENLILKSGYDEYYAAKCLRYATRLIDNGLPVIFDMKHLALLIGTQASDIAKILFAEERFYTSGKIPKKSGGYRELDMPSLDVKYIQRWILDNILEKIRISEYAMGFCRNKSILDNARIHINKHCIVNMDIKDFFPTITYEQVFRMFLYFGYTREISFTLAKLCTFDGRLPQGSPASPYLSNILCLKLDARLSALARKYEASYSRYADDITFSGKKDIKSIVDVAISIILDEGFIINDKKTRILYPHQRQEVTGLLVNGDKIRICKKYKRELYQELYYCSKYGVENHLQKIGCNKSFYKEHVYGKIYFVNMVEPNEAEKMFAIAKNIQWDY